MLVAVHERGVVMPRPARDGRKSACDCVTVTGRPDMQRPKACDGATGGNGMATGKSRPDRLEQIARTLLALALAAAVSWVWFGGDNAPGMFAHLVD